jgi:hypothetical protein
MRGSFSVGLRVVGEALTMDREERPSLFWIGGGPNTRPDSRSYSWRRRLAAKRASPGQGALTMEARDLVLIMVQNFAHENTIIYHWSCAKRGLSKRLQVQWSTTMGERRI